MNQSKRLNTFLLCFLLVNVFFLALYKIDTYDFWIHLATGRYLWQTGAIPQVNTFSYTFPTYPWRYLVGPFQLTLYIIYLIAGLNGIIIYKALLLCLLFYYLWQVSSHENVPPPLQFLLLFLASLAMRERFSERPQLWLCLFIAYYLWALLRYQQTSNKKFLFALPLLQVLWVNTHGSFLIGYYLVGLMAALVTVKTFLDAYFPKFSFLVQEVKCSLKELWLTLIILAAVSLLNPHGWRIFTYPFDIGSQQVALLSVAERQPPDLVRWAGPYGLLIALSFLALLVGLYRRQWFLILALLPFALMSAKALRFIDIYSTTAAATLPLLLFSGSFPSITKLATKMYFYVISIIIAIIATSYICLFDPAAPLGLGVNQFTTPVGAADFLVQNRIAGPIFNDIDLGDYLIWRLYPGEKVFIDGRRFSAYPQEFYEKTEFLHTAGQAWDALRSKYNFNVAILPYLPINIEKLFPKSSWALVFWDDAAMVFLRRTAENKNLITSNEFSYFLPTRFSDLQAKSSPLNAGYFEDLRRSRDLHPDSYRVNFAFGYYYSWQGAEKTGLAESYLKKTILICPLFAPAYAQLGLLYSNTGRYDEAIRYLKQSIKIAPEFRIAYFYLSSIYGILHDQNRAKAYLKKYQGS